MCEIMVHKAKINSFDNPDCGTTWTVEFAIHSEDGYQPQYRADYHDEADAQLAADAWRTEQGRALLLLGHKMRLPIEMQEQWGTLDEIIHEDLEDIEAHLAGAPQKHVCPYDYCKATFDDAELLDAHLFQYHE